MGEKEMLQEIMKQLQTLNEQLNSQGEQLNLQGKQLRSQGEQLNSQGKQQLSHGEQLAQLVGAVSRLSTEMHEEMDSLRSLVEGQGEVLVSVVEQLGELDTKVDNIANKLQRDIAAVEYTAHKTATDMAELKLAK